MRIERSALNQPRTGTVTHAAGKYTPQAVRVSELVSPEPNGGVLSAMGMLQQLIPNALLVAYLITGGLWFRLLGARISCR